MEKRLVGLIAISIASIMLTGCSVTDQDISAKIKKTSLTPLITK